MLRLTLAALVAGTPVAADPDGFYLKAFAGLSSLQDTDVTVGASTETSVGFDSGLGAGGAFGYGYGDSPWAAELEFAYRTGDSRAGATDGGDFASTTFMLNGVYHFGTSGRVTPYAGGGLGYVTEIDFDVPGIGEFSDRGGLAWQVFAGATYSFSERVSVFGELRYFDAGGRTLNGASGALSADYATIDIAAGVIIAF